MPEMRMPRILTASWRAGLPDLATPIGISRGTPRRVVGYRRLRALEPGDELSRPDLDLGGLEHGSKLSPRETDDPKHWRNRAAQMRSLAATWQAPTQPCGYA